MHKRALLWSGGCMLALAGLIGGAGLIEYGVRMKNGACLDDGYLVCVVSFVCCGVCAGEFFKATRR